MADIIIYAAGNPDLYPIEYYDSDTESYVGIIPEMLKEFSREHGYEFSYYRADEGDMREELGKNHQVDIISGCIEGEDTGDFDETEGFTSVRLFMVEEDGQTSAYEVYVTDAAPEGLSEELAGFAAEYSAQKQLGTAVTLTAEHHDTHGDMIPYFGAVAALVLALAVIAAVFIVKYRKAGKKYRESIERNQVTGMMTEISLKEWAEKKITSQNKVLYSLIYFKIDNEYLHTPGRMEKIDEFYRYAASVINDYISENDGACVTEENGFALLCQSLTPDAVFEKVTEAGMRITAFFRNDISSDRMIVSAGICHMGTFGGTVEESLRYAFYAAVSAKKKGLPYLVCDDSFIYALNEETTLRDEVTAAVKGEEMEIYLQFYVDAASSEIAGAEALARWNHPERGVLGPAHFIPVLEDEGLVSIVDYYCLEKVCGFLDELADMGTDGFFVSCNFSRKTFASDNFVEKWKEIVERHRFPKGMLVFELTESVDPEYRKQLHDNLLETRKQGIHVFLDDFGEGFTSLYDLREYAVDGVKLDRTITDHADTERGRSILSALIALGHEMDVKIVAEGVESAEQADVLRDLGCDIIQGFSLHYPAPLWDIKRSLRESRLLP